MKHTLGELYRMKHIIENSLQENEYDIYDAERKVVEAKGKRLEILKGLTDVNELIKKEEKSGGND